MESTYFDYDWENFFMDDIGLCEKNDRRRTKFDFMSEVCVAFMEKGINKRNAHHILSLKMSDEQIEKYFNTNSVCRKSPAKAGLFRMYKI